MAKKAASQKTLIGVIHLPPLPGAPLWSPPAKGQPLEPVIQRAVKEARILADAGFDGIIIENLGDRPYYPAAVPPETVAALTAVALCVRKAVNRETSVGVNVLRNDAQAALGIAVAASLSFIRVNVHTGVAAADQGLIEGQAHRTLRQRHALGFARRVGILADVLVKHARTLSPDDVTVAVEDAVGRGLADAAIISGDTTSRPVDMETLEAASRAFTSAGRKRMPKGARLLVGSGATADSAASLLNHCDGIIVGTALKRGGDLSRPVDRRLARGFVRAARSA